MFLTIFPELGWDQEVLLKCKNIAKYATYVLNGRGLLLQITLYSISMSSEEQSLTSSLQIASTSTIPKIKLFFFLGNKYIFSCRTFAVYYAANIFIF